jgi:ethanolamine ammonia-lyase small subunit
MSIDRALLERLVREVVSETLHSSSSSAASGSAAAAAGSSSSSGAACNDDKHCVPPVRHERIEDAGEVRRVQEATPARLSQGRVGTRYTTSAYITLRAEHAIALDAVHSRVSDDFAQRHGLVSLATKAKDHAEFLLHPDLGRRLNDASRERLLQEGTRGADVVVIVGDGLSALAAETQVPKLLPALLQALSAERFSVGKSVFVRHARIGVQDEIGVLLGARSTIILVGERPGLGTGDSLSIYTAFKPRLNQENAEKNCISNIRDLGFPPAEAAIECARLMRRTFDAGGGGVHLVRPVRDIMKRATV